MARKNIAAIAAHRFVRPLIQQYLSNERTYRYKNISIRVLPGVFHPGFFFSTKFLLQYIDTLNLKNNSLLELGAGSGLISFYAEKKGAIVTTTDLSEKAIENLQLNRSLVHSKIHIIRSDLFDYIPKQAFDFIIINPPYYPNKPTTDDQLAWYCGEEYEYFEKLFSQLSNFIHPFSKVILVLSGECDHLRIKSIASKNNFQWVMEWKKRFWWEWNYIFAVTLLKDL